MLIINPNIDNIFSDPLFQISFCTAFFFGFIVIISKKIFSNYEENIFEPQKIHLKETPRVGSIAIIFGIIAVLIINKSIFYQQYQFLLFIALPCFFAGIFEDFTKKVPPIIRLIASISSGILFVLFLKKE